jgi:membrane-bound metal-dependent hydrolase YbcI (DUF457 family)
LGSAGGQTLRFAQGTQPLRENGGYRFPSIGLTRRTPINVDIDNARMKRSTHLAVGLAVVTPLAMSQEPATAAACIWFSLAGAAMPDWLDFRSDLRQPLRLRHRGVSHSLVALAICTAIAWLVLTAVTRNPLTLGDVTLSNSGQVPRVIAVAFALGFVSHLAADACTPAGIAPFLPFSSRRCWLLPRRLRGKTGGRLDAFTRWVAWTVVGFSLVVAAGRWFALPV